ncbi:hypothetical protein [Streptomyces sp. NPDC102347]|uniref:hypothetical protein n=1 Tax=Streptomyces sp. NPDC102347 TaxID=3366157 RepID=UPI00380F15CE
MNRIPDKGAVRPVRQPARLVASVLDGVLLLLGADPLTGRILAHLRGRALALAVPGLSNLPLLAVGTTLPCLALRRAGGANRPHLQGN